MKMDQLWLVTKPEERVTGLSRYVDSLEDGLDRLNRIQVQRIYPRLPLATSPITRSLQRLNFDLQAFLSSYPLQIERPDCGIYHLTSQNLATLLATQHIHPAVVTVHDLIPLLVQGDAQLDTQRHTLERIFFRLAISGLRRADSLIAISEYTRQSIIKALGYPAERIHVVYRAVDLERFQPMEVVPTIYGELGLEPDKDYILYLGSDDPRKNLSGLIQAFAQIHSRFPQARLIKAGASHFAGERQRLVQLIADLSLQDKVVFLENLPDKHLPALYNLIRVFVLPSFYEGFGLPALEAMACGAPVLASQRASLPEVVGEAGMLFDPDDIHLLADYLEQLLGDPDLRQQLSRAGRMHASQFSLERQAQQTLAVYERWMDK